MTEDEYTKKLLESFDREKNSILSNINSFLQKIPEKAVRVNIFFLLPPLFSFLYVYTSETIIIYNLNLKEMKKLLFTTMLIFAAIISINAQSQVTTTGLFSPVPPSSYSVTITYYMGDGSGDSVLTYLVDVDANGYFYDTLMTDPDSSSIVLNFIDCNGTSTTFAGDYVSNSNGFADYNFGTINYCPALPPACTAGFTLSQNVVIDSLTNITTVLSNVLVSNTSTGSNLTYTFDFGDGSAPYTGVNFTHIYAGSGPYNLCISIDDSTGCTDTFCDSVMVDSSGVLSGKTNGSFIIEMGDGSDDTNAPTGINNLEESFSVNLYPNPANDFVNLKIEAEKSELVNIVIYDLVGKVVQNKELDLNSGANTIKIELNNNLNGMYIIKLKATDGFLTKMLYVK